MTRYVAFLRAVNVGGRNAVSMDGLRRTLASLGLRQVETFLQSGNVAFDAAGKDPDALALRISRAIADRFRVPVGVMVRSLSDLERLVRKEPFGRGTRADEKRYVVFLGADRARARARRVASEKEGLEALPGRGRDVLVVSRPVGGRYGFPNGFVERELAVPATSRNWNTVQKIVAAGRRPVKTDRRPQRDGISARASVDARRG